MEYIQEIRKDEFRIVKVQAIAMLNAWDNWHGCKLRSIPQIAYEVERISSE